MEIKFHITEWDEKTENEFVVQLSNFLTVYIQNSQKNKADKTNYIKSSELNSLNIQK